MAYTTIDDPSVYFQTTLYTGNAGALNIVNGGNSDLQPDWVWLKDRGASNSHRLVDSSRGVQKALRSNATSAEGTDTGLVTAFNSDGFSHNSTDTAWNGSGDSYVAWQWKANGGTTTTNDASATSIGNQDSVFQANTTAGFSIVTWTGSNANATLAHGLGAVPNWIIVKARGGTEGWGVYHHKNTSAPETDHLRLDTTDATLDSTNVSNDTAPTSTVFTVADSGIANEVGKTYVGYLFAEKQGYSKFGSYTGNGNADGTFVYTGFKPAWVMVKEYGANTNDWNIYDSKRSAFNSMDDILEANLSDAEGTGRADIDFVSNGFKQRNTHADSNRSGGEFIYMAFAEHPFVSSEGVPTTAR